MAGEKYLIDIAAGNLPANGASASLTVEVHRDDTGAFANLTPGAYGSRDFLRADEFATQTVAAPDMTAPIPSAVSGTQTGATTATWSAASNEAGGTMFAATWPAASADPIDDQVIAGTGGSIVAADSDTTPTADANNGGSFAGLTGSTEYQVGVVHRDAAGNDSALVVSAGTFTTAAAVTVLPTYDFTLTGTTAGGETWTNGIPAAGTYIIGVGVIHNGTGQKGVTLSGPNLTVTPLGDQEDFGDDGCTAALFHVVASAASDITLAVTGSIFNETRLIVCEANGASATVRTTGFGNMVSPVSASLSGLTAGDIVIGMVADRQGSPTAFLWGDALTGAGIRQELSGTSGYAMATAAATGATFTGSVSEASMAVTRDQVLLLVAVEPV